MKNGNSANINRMMGNDGNFVIKFPMNWEDSYNTRIGFEIDATKDFTLRVGGAFGSNPVPSQTVFPVFPAIVESHLTAGFTYKLSPAFAVHTAYERALNNSQTAATPSIVAQEFSNSTTQLNEKIYHLSFSWIP